MLSIKEDRTNKAKQELPKAFPLQMKFSISLSNLRIIQKHLVYVIGLSEEMANNDVLGKYEYFGQYGSIQKIAVNKTKVYNKAGSSVPNYSAYISFALEEEASMAILAIDNFQCGDYLLRASYGTTKYCTFFLKGSQCPNKDCLYYHSISNDEDIINKEDMNSSSNVFYQQQKTAMRICNIFSNETKMKLKLLSSTSKKTVFPILYSIYQKEIVIKNDLILKTHHKTAMKLSNVFNYPQAKSLNHMKPIEAIDNLVKLTSEEELTPASLHFHGKIAKVKSMKENLSLLSSSSVINFKRINIPNHKRLTFDNINHHHCTNSSLFRKHKHSRFDFTSMSQESPVNTTKIEDTNCLNYNEEENDNETVPDYVSDLIGITLSRFSFFKQFNHFNNNETEQLLCNTFCYQQKDTWSQFILNNINNNKVVTQ